MGKDDARPVEDWVAVAEAIRDRLDQQRITQMELATKAGVSLAMVQELVKPLPRKRQPRTLAAISSALGWPDNYIQALLHGQPLATPEPLNDDALRAVQEELQRINRRLDALEADRHTGES